jgi:hypothetical protein
VECVADRVRLVGATELDLFFDASLRGHRIIEEATH